MMLGGKSHRYPLNLYVYIYIYLPEPGLRGHMQHLQTVLHHVEIFFESCGM